MKKEHATILGYVIIGIATLVGFQYISFRSCTNQIKEGLSPTGQPGSFPASCSEKGYEYDSKNDIMSVTVSKFPFKATYSMDQKTGVLTKK